MGLIIPNRSQRRKFLCTICPAEFGEDERHQFERHVLSHPPEDIQPHSPRMRAPGLYDPHHESGDVEWQRWIDENNEVRPAEWRKWMKTSE
jgi:hypothetical protein